MSYFTAIFGTMKWIHFQFYRHVKRIWHHWHDSPIIPFFNNNKTCFDSSNVSKVKFDFDWKLNINHIKVICFRLKRAAFGDIGIYIAKELHEIYIALELHETFGGNTEIPFKNRYCVVLIRCLHINQIAGSKFNVWILIYI